MLKESTRLRYRPKSSVDITQTVSGIDRIRWQYFLLTLTLLASVSQSDCTLATSGVDGTGGMKGTSGTTTDTDGTGGMEGTSGTTTGTGGTGGSPPAPTCVDGMKNGDETDIDCGGPDCSDCAIDKTCLVNADCLSNNCATGICAPPAPTCMDGLKNGSETDIDCGGVICLDCNDGKICLVGGDCVSGVCKDVVGAGEAVCIPFSCDDAVKNGSETDIDCGGADCGACIGTPCGDGGECASGLCQDSACKACTDNLSCSQDGVICIDGVCTPQ